MSRARTDPVGRHRRRAHDRRSRARRRSLHERGATVHVDETLQSLGRIQRAVLRDGSRVLFRYAPRLFGAYYRLLLRFAPARALAARSLVRFGARTLLRMVDEHRPDLVISTYPATTVVLAALRSPRRVAVPAVATITDVAGLFFWAQPGIDLHLVNWARVDRRGARDRAAQRGACGSPADVGGLLRRGLEGRGAPTARASAYAQRSWSYRAAAGASATSPAPRRRRPRSPTRTSSASPAATSAFAASLTRRSRAARTSASSASPTA